MTADITGDADADIVLVVDLDGTLCRTDTLHEALLQRVVQSPLSLFRLPGGVIGQSQT